MIKPGRWEEFDTTADTGLEVWANSYIELLITAAMAFTEMTTDPKTLTEYGWRKEEMDIEGDVDEMFREFLDFFLFRLDTESILPVSIKNLVIYPGHGVEAEVEYHEWTHEKSESRTEIKAVTWHMLKVEKKYDQWYGRVVFDI